MDRDLDILDRPLAARGPVLATPPVLIRVPALAGAATATTAAPPRRRPSQSFRPGRVRRRLRREVRVAGLATLGALAIALAATALRPAPAIATPAPPEATPVSIVGRLEPLEPAAAVAAADPADSLRAPVISPGALVPEDVVDEEAPNAGG